MLCMVWMYISPCTFNKCMYEISFHDSLHNSMYSEYNLDYQNNAHVALLKGNTAVLQIPLRMLNHSVGDYYIR